MRRRLRMCARRMARPLAGVAWIRSVAVVVFGPIHMGAGAVLRSAYGREQGLSRARSARSGTSPTTSRFLLLEMIGPSGVGKTTLGRRMLHGDERFRMVTTHRSVHVGAVRNAGAEPHLLDHAYRALLRRKVDIMLSRDLALDACLRVLEFQSTNLMEDVVLTAARPDATILRDEGLLQNYKDVLADAPEHLFDTVVRDRIVLHCSAPLDAVVDRVLARRRSGQDRTLVADADVDEIQRRVDESRAKSLRLRDRLVDSGVPLIDLDLTDPVTDTLDQVASFLRRSAVA